MSLEVTSMKLFATNFKSKGGNVGFGTITLNGVLDIKINIFMGSDGNLYISLPSRQVTKQSGSTEWQKMVEWTKEANETKNAITEKVCAEFAKIMVLKDGKIPTSKSEPAKEMPTATPIRAGFMTIPIPSTEEEPAFDSSDEPTAKVEMEPTVAVPERKKPAVIWGVPRQ